MKEFTKVSIHNHLGGRGADRTLNDSYDIQCNFNFASACSLVDNANDNQFTLLALTHSNRLPAESYLKLKKYAKSKNITILPGAEINLKNEEERYLHTVVVFDDKNPIEEIEKRIDDYINENKHNHLEIDQFLDLVIEYKCIISAHGIKQKTKQRSASTNADTFSELINLSDAIPVVIEDNHKYHKKTLKEELKDQLTSNELDWVDKTAIISAADRTSFNQIVSPTYIWGNPNFDDLYYACFMSETRIKRESDIINKVNYIDKIVVDAYQDAQVRPKEIVCSHGLNTIIGPSGSGKTMLLDIIRRKLTGKGLENKSISKNSNYEEVYDLNHIHLYDGKGVELTKDSGYSIVEGEILYNKVITAYQADKESLLNELHLVIDKTELDSVIMRFNLGISQYVKNSIEINKNRTEINTLLKANSSIIEFLDANVKPNNDTLDYSKDDNIASKIKSIDEKIRDIASDITDLDQKFSEISKIANKYSVSDEFYKDIKSIRLRLTNTLNKKMKSLDSSICELSEKMSKQEIIYNAVIEYNSKIGTQYQTIVERRQNLMTNFNKIKDLVVKNITLINSLKIPVLSEDIIKNSIDFKNQDIAQLTFSKINLSINKDDLKDAFPTNIGNKPKLKASLFSVQNLNLGDETCLKEFLQTFIDNNYDQQIQLSFNDASFVDYKIELKTLEGNFENIDNITAGNLSKIYINKMFEDKIIHAGSNTIILYDQPDANMEKEFILSELVTKISKIRDTNQIFITTHEPLLVVNSDSNNIIAATNEKTAIKKNDIEYTNKSFVGVNSRKELVQEVAKLIDGSPEAVKRRSIIYGGVLNED